MNARVYLIGLVGGLLTGLTLNYPLHDYLPSAFVPGWPPIVPIGGWSPASAGWAWALVVVAILIVLGTGALGARTSGASEWRRGTMAGGIAGLIAALIAEAWVGGAAAGVWAVRDLLAGGLEPVADAKALAEMTVRAALSVQTWSYLSSWIAVLGGLGLGAVGGFAARVGGPRAEQMPKLYRTLALVGLLISALALIVVSVSSISLRDSLQNLADQTTLPIAGPLDDVITWPVGAGFAALLMWQALGWWWLGSSNPHTAREQRTVLLSIYLNASLPWALAILLFVIARPLFANILILLALAFSLGLGVMTLILVRVVQSREITAADEPEGWRYYVLVGALSAVILFATVYAVGLVGPLNMVLLVTPITAALSPTPMSGPAPDLTPAGIVNSAYRIHLSLLAYFGVAAPFLTLIAAVSGWLFDRFAAISTPKGK